MKRIITLLSIVLSAHVFGQIEGMWKLAPQAGALAVGPNQGDGFYWSNTLQDVTDRACLFDDSISFDASGNMVHYMDGSTWLEEWQGVAAAQCGTPAAPFDGTTNAPYTYVYDSGAGTLTVNGIGAHIGLPKVINGTEITSTANAASSIVYEVSFVNGNNTMLVDISFVNGSGATNWWRFTYQRTNVGAITNPLVTFQVDMSDYPGTITTGVYVQGSFFNWLGDGALMNNVGNNIWELEVELPVSNVEYLFHVDSWAAFEVFDATYSCIDPFDDGFYNRYYEVTNDAIIPIVCFNSCEACIAGIDSKDAVFMNVYPNPSNEYFMVSSENKIESIALVDLNGRMVISEIVNDNSFSIDVKNIENGTYMLIGNTIDGIYRKEVVVSK